MNVPLALRRRATSNMRAGDSTVLSAGVPIAIIPDAAPVQRTHFVAAERPKGPILAIDPSATATGYAVVSTLHPKRPLLIESGTWHPSAAKGAPDRYDQLADFMARVIADHSVTTAIIETPSGGQRHSATQLMVYAQAIGVCRAACHRSGAVVMPVKVNEWKGQARKSGTALYAAAAFGISTEGRSHNEMDALGIADWWLRIGSKTYGVRVEIRAVQP